MPHHSRPQRENAGRELSRRRESIHPPPQVSVRTACGSGRVGLRSDVTYTKHFHPLYFTVSLTCERNDGGNAMSRVAAVFVFTDR